MNFVFQRRDTTGGRKPTMSKTHESLVTDQFGPRAAAYVASTVHAGGADLDRIEALARAYPGGRALDLGCGGGHVSYRVAPHVAEVVALDLSAEMLAAVQSTAQAKGLRNLVTRQAAVEEVPYPTGSFDLLFTRYSAHHWRDFARGLREARRVLKPGGRAMFADAYAPGVPLLDTFIQAIELLRDPSHVRNYTMPEWETGLREAGFKVHAANTYRLPLEFASWVRRMQTPDVHARAIRSLERCVSLEVTQHFAILPDGSFTLDTMAIEAEAA